MKLHGCISPGFRLLLELQHVPFHKRSLRLPHIEVISQLQLNWIVVINSVLTARKGVSAMQLTKETGVQYRTAWYMLHID